MIADVQRLARRVRAATPEQVQALDAVLEEFFTLEEDGWHNSRCDAEIAAYHQKQKQQSEAGKASAAKRSQGKAAAEGADIPSKKAPKKMSTDVEQPLNGRSTNQNQNQNHINTPQPPASGGDVAQKLFSFFPQQRRTRLAEVSALVADLVDAGTVTADELLAAAAQQSAVLGKDDGKGCPSVLRWLRDQRWMDSGIYAPSGSSSAWHGLPTNWMETKSGIEAMGQLLGLGVWDDGREKLFSSYENRVMRALQERGSKAACAA